MKDTRTKLREILQSAIDACQPSQCLPEHLPPFPKKGRVIVLGAGKAASAMAASVEQTYFDQGLDPNVGKLFGTVATRHGYGIATRLIEVQEAGHPVPDGASLKAADTALRMASHAHAEDLILVLLSGGASAIWCSPLTGISLDQNQSLTTGLLRSGMPIRQINTIRKHLSRIKGGRLAGAANPTPVLTLAISDVPGDLASVIGSGPTVADETTLADARAAMSKYGIVPDDNIRRALEDVANETPKDGDRIFANCRYKVVASASDALKAAALKAGQLGYQPLIIGDQVESEARDVAREHAALATRMKQKGQRAILISGGELTVSVKGKGMGGPNQEYALALLMALNGEPGISALAADTDGSDGGMGGKNDPAGAFITPEMPILANEADLNPAIFLENNDSSTFFRCLDSLIITGPTQTNVNDLRLILIDP